MDKKTILLGVIIVFVFSWGIYLYFNQANAEVFEELISFPIPDNVKQTDVRKQIITMTDDMFEFQITYRFTADEVKQWYEENLAQTEIFNPECEFGYNPVTDECLEEIIPPIESNFVPEKKPIILTKYEADIVYFETNLPLDKDEQDYFNQLRFLAECEQGLNQSRGIQQERSVIYSEYTVDTSLARAGHITGNAGELKIAIEECIGQIKLMVLVGDDRQPDDFRSKQSYFGEEQVHHGDYPHYDKEFWASIPTHETNSLKLTEHAFEVENQTAWERMCASENVSEDFKKQQGCPSTIVYEYTALRTSGGIPLNNYIQDAFDRYNAFGESEQLAKIQSQIRHEQELQRKIVESAFNER